MSAFSNKRIILSSQQFQGHCILPYNITLQIDHHGKSISFTCIEKRMQDAGAEWIYLISSINPFTHAVEALRYALYGEFAPLSLTVVSISTVIFYLIAAAGYDPQRELVKTARGG
jgi:hypothetical protein